MLLLMCHQSCSDPVFEVLYTNKEECLPHDNIYKLTPQRKEASC